MPKFQIKNGGRICLYGAERSKCNHVVTLGLKGLIYHFQEKLLHVTAVQKEENTAT